MDAAAAQGWAALSVVAAMGPFLVWGARLARHASARGAWTAPGLWMLWVLGLVAAWTLLGLGVYGVLRG